ncbi:hypothetical protein ACS0TY_005823 [Phlomoides rotata]
MAPQLKVAVIGAGVAVLAAARALKSEGHLPVIYEKSEKLGGTWVYDPEVESDPLGVDPNREIVHISLYHSLRTNLPRQLMGFSDNPFSTDKNRDPRTFPGHEEVLQFLNEFATHFGLIQLIRFQTKVVRVDHRNHRWVVESTTITSHTFDALVVCNGHYTHPIVANFPGQLNCFNLNYSLLILMAHIINRENCTFDPMRTLFHDFGYFLITFSFIVIFCVKLT